MGNKEEYDVIVVGTGAGGSTVAREMALKGKKVLSLEKGGRWPYMGNPLSIMMGMSNFGANLSRQGNFVTLPDNYGGLSNFSAGCAFHPNKEIWGPAGIDLSEEAEEAKKEMKIKVTPDEFLGDQNIRLLETANSLGYNWTKAEKFMASEKCVNNCDKTLYGDKYGAKWTARVYGDEAVARGAELKLNHTVTDIIVSEGKAVGVKAKHFGITHKYFGKKIVLSGGFFNVFLLRKAGIKEAGQSFTCDWLQFNAAVIPGMNNKNMNQMAVGDTSMYESDGIIIMPTFPGFILFAGLALSMGPKALTKIMKFSKYTGIMVKIRDESSGTIDNRYKGPIPCFSKTVTDTDQKKLEKGNAIVKEIVTKAGADPDSIFKLNVLGAHPSSTCAVGKVVNTDLETEIENLYCCDASVTPCSLGTPVIWTAVSLGKRLAKHLNDKL